MTLHTATIFLWVGLIIELSVGVIFRIQHHSLFELRMENLNTPVPPPALHDFPARVFLISPVLPLNIEGKTKHKVSHGVFTRQCRKSIFLKLILKTYGEVGWIHTISYAPRLPTHCFASETAIFALNLRIAVEQLARCLSQKAVPKSLISPQPASLQFRTLSRPPPFCFMCFRLAITQNTAILGTCPHSCPHADVLWLNPTALPCFRGQKLTCLWCNTV